MTPQASSSAPAPSRLFAAGEWIVMLGLAATLAWTTLCLGGYMAKTMVVTSWAVFGLAALGAGLWVVGRGSEPQTFNRAVLLPVPFLLYALASVLWLAPAQWLAWREWLLWFQMWLVFALALHFGRGRGHTWVVVITVVLLGLAGVGMAAYQRFVDPKWMMLGRTQAVYFIGRSGGMFGIPNSLAGLLELMTPGCLVLLFSRATRVGVKVLCGWLAVIFIFALVLTGSRGGWLGLGLALIAWPLITGREWRRKLIGLGLVLLTLLLGFWALYHFSAHGRTRIQPFLEGKFETTRPLIWKAGWQIWQEHPWFGSGAASYNVLFEQYRPRGFLDEPDWTHNDYLNTLGDYGLAGFVLWAGAGGGLLALGWAAVRRARRKNQGAGGLLGLWRWRLGLLLGLLAFACHMMVDFHTKLPALAFLAAIMTALLLRDEPGLNCSLRPVIARVGGGVILVVVLGLAWRVAAPLYRAEALRFDARRTIDRYAKTGQGNLNDIIVAAKADFRRAVRLDPANGQAWSDLSYATVQSWRAGGGDLVTLGRYAELASDEALQLCPLIAEFWVRKGVALDAQRGRPEAESCFRRAVELAPHSPRWWYHYAYHLQAFPSRKQEAIRAVETCLALDRYYADGDALHQQLVTRH